mmetsp:Transcript_15980/g.34519  ORF Transcript_15980/g.34519 Transcript_15980/m.34519 type:complete len:450 (-) Transcript_15980:598-1947(-)
MQQHRANQVCILVAVAILAAASGATADDSSCPEPTQIIYGINSLCLIYKGNYIPYYVWIPPTFVDGKYTIGITSPGENATLQAAIDNFFIADLLNTAFIVPNLNVLTYAQALGNVFPDSAYSPEDRSLLPGSVPNPSSDWYFDLVVTLYNTVAHLVKGGKGSYILLGMNSGALFVQSFAMLHMPSLKTSDQPLNILVANSPYYLTPSVPLLKPSYLEPVNTSTCFTGHIPQLVNHHPDLSGYVDSFSDMVKGTTEENMLYTMSDMIAMVAQMTTLDINNTLYDYTNTAVFAQPNLGNQLPYPYGLGGLVPAVSSGYHLLAKALAAAPLAVVVGDRDTNVHGGVNASCAVLAPLDNSTNAAKQGPYPLARAINVFTTMRGIALSNSYDFNWQITVVPGVGHNNVALAQSLQMGYAAARQDASWLQYLLLNPDFTPENYHYELWTGPSRPV